LLEMLVDPMCSLSFEAEPEEPDVMRRTPRDPESQLVSRSLLKWAAVQGLIAMSLLIGLAAWANWSGMDARYVRSTCFAGLIVTVLALVFANRVFKAAPEHATRKRNVPLLMILAVAALIFGAVFLLPSVAGLLHFAVLNARGLAGIGILAVVLALLLTMAKRGFRDALVR
jgi:Ca2+-transporting ATPase